jgi:hypothetical protein
MPALAVCLLPTVRAQNLLECLHANMHVFGILPQA